MAKPWSESELKYLSEYYQTKSVAELSKELGRTPRGVIVRAKMLGLTEPLKRWTTAEVKFLQENYSKLGPKRCSETLNRTIDSVCKKCGQLKIHYTRQHENISKDTLLLEYSDNKQSITKIADKYGLKPDDVYYALNKHGISIDKTGMYFGNKHHMWRGCGEISQSRWGGIVSCAKDRGLEFNIDIEYAWNLFLKQNRKCAISGVKLFFSKVSVRYWENTTASLDRIDSSIGYVHNNVQWVHKTVNIMKMNLDESEFINWCKIISNYRA